MIKALVLVVRYAVLNVKLAFCKNRAKRFRMMNEFEKFCK